MDLSSEPPPTEAEIAQASSAAPAAQAPDGKPPIDTSKRVSTASAAAYAPPGVKPAADLDLSSEPPPTEAEIAAARRPSAGALRLVSAHGDLPSPDQAAQITSTSAATGLPASIVQADPTGFTQKLQANGIDWDAMVDHAPGLAGFLADNPHALRLVQPDVQNLGTIETAFSHRLAEAWLDAWHEQGTVGLELFHGLGFSGFDDAIRQRLQEEQQGRQQYGEDYGATNFLSKAAIRSARFVPYMALDITSRAVGALVGAATGLAAGTPGGPVALITGALGGIGGEELGSFAFNYAEALGQKSWELDHAVDAQGRPVSRVKADLGAQGDAIATGALMSLGMGVFGKGAGAAKEAFPAAAKALEGVGKNAVVRWLNDGAIRGLLARVAGRFGLSAAIGTGMMAANAGINQATDELVRGAPGSVPSAMWEGGTKGFEDLWLLSLVDPNFRAGVSRLGEMAQTHQATAKLQAAVKAAQASTVLDKSPTAFEQIVQRAAPDAKVYIPADKWVSYFQGQKLDPSEMAKNVGVTPEALTQASATGGNVEMHVAKYLGQLAKDGHAAGLSADAKLDPNGETLNESKAALERDNARMIQAAKDNEPELSAGKKTIEQYVMDQGKAAGIKPELLRSGAKILAQAAETQALRTNTSINEAARQLHYGDLFFTGKTGVTPEHQAVQDRFNEWLAPKASQLLKERLGSLSPESRALELYLDPNTGLPNAEHFEDMEALAPDGQPPAYAHMGIEGTKFVNDSLDHGKGNLLYRAAAKALHEAAPEAGISKTGGDFEAKVRDQDHLDEILAKANENLPPELKGFRITGALGDTREAAEKAHIALKESGEVAGTRAKRRSAPLGFQGDIKALRFPEERATATINPELAKRAATMTDKEYFSRAYVEPKTGLLTGLGWRLLPDHGESYHYGALDLRGLKDANISFGKEGGNKLIEGFGKILAHYGGSSFEAAHVSGDEYAIRGKDPVALAKLIDRLREKLTNRFEAIDPDGDLADVSVDFWHGLGKGSLDAADRALNERKSAAKKEEALLPARAAAGVEDHGNEGGRRADLAFRGGDLGRGASAQAYPGPGERGPGRQEVVLGQGAFGHRVVVEPGGEVPPPGDAQFRRDGLVGQPPGAEGAGALDVPARGPITSTAALESDLAGEPGVHQDAPNALSANAKALSDAFDRPAFKAKGFRGLKTPAKRMMLQAVLSVIHEPQVLDAVVRAIPVDVVNDLGGKKLTAEELLHDPAVLFDRLAVHLESPVAVSVEAAAAIDATARAAARAAAELSTALPRLPVGDRKGLSADSAGAGGQGPSSAGELALVAAKELAKPPGREDLGAGGAGQPNSASGLGHGDRLSDRSVVAHVEGRPVELRQDPTGGGGEGETPRGQIMLDLADTGRPRAFNIQLLNADKSTFIHEVAHFLSFSLHDLAQSDLATPQVKEDYETLLRFMGYDSAAARVAAQAAGAAAQEERDKKEEKLASAFEMYILEGKAPTQALARVFSRMRGWMLKIYKGVEGVQELYQKRYGEPIQLSDDVRQVFDRILSQDGALTRAKEAVGGMEPDAEAMKGMTPEEVADYRKTIEEANIAAEQASARGDVRQKEIDAARAIAQKQVEAGLDQQPVYRAWRYLQKGELPDAERASLTDEQFKDFWLDDKGKPFKINRSYLTQEFGDDAAAKMPPGSMRRGGLPTDVVAAQLGFDSARDMVEALTSATPRDRAVQEGTQAKMDAAYGQELERETAAALSGVHNAKALDAEVMALRGLAKQINPTLAQRAQAIDLKALRQNIDRMTGEKYIDQLKPARYANSEKRLATEAAYLEGKGEKEAAFDKKQQRLMNKLLFMSERDAKEEMAKARARLGMRKPRA